MNTKAQKPDALEELGGGGVGNMVVSSISEETSIAVGARRTWMRITFALSQTQESIQNTSELLGCTILGEFDTSTI